MNNAVDRRIGPDSQRQREHSHNRKARRLAKLAQSIPDVLKQRLHGAPSVLEKQFQNRTKSLKTRPEPALSLSTFDESCPLPDRPRVLPPTKGRLTEARLR